MSTLTPQELEIARTLRLQGKNTDEVYNYIAGKRVGAPSRLSTVRQESIEIPKTDIISDIPQDIFTGVKQLGEGYQERFGKMKESVSAGMRGEQTPIETGVQLGANLAGGLFGDTAYQLLRTGGSFVTTPDQEEKIAQKFGEGVTKVGEKTGITNWYTGLDERAKRNVNAALDVLDIAPVPIVDKVKGLFGKTTPSIDATPKLEQALIKAEQGDITDGARIANSVLDDTTREQTVSELAKAYQDSLVGDRVKVNRLLQEQATDMSRGDVSVTQDDLVKAMANEGVIPDIRGKLADFTTEIQKLNQRQSELFKAYEPVLASSKANAPIEDFYSYALRSMSDSPNLRFELNKADAQLKTIIDNLRRSYNLDEGGTLTAKQIDDISRQANARTSAYRETDTFQADVYSELGRAARQWLKENVPDESFQKVNEQWLRLENIKRTAEAMQNQQVDVGVLGRALGSYVTTLTGVTLGASVGNPFMAVAAGVLTKMGGDALADALRTTKFSPEIRAKLQERLTNDKALIAKLKETATTQENKNLYDQLSRMLPPAREGSFRSEVSSGAPVRVAPQGESAPAGQIIESAREGAIKQPGGEGRPLSRSMYPELTDADLQKLKTDSFRKLLSNAGIDPEDVTKAIAGGTIGILLATYLNEDGSMLPAFGAIMGLAASRGGKLQMLDDAIEANMKRRNVLSAAGKEATSREMKVIDAQYQSLVRERNKVRDSLSPGLGIRDVSKDASFNKGVTPTKLTPDPELKTKRAIPMKDVAGNKFEVSEGTVLKPKINDKGQAILTVNGKSYTVPKNQYDNLKGQSTRSVAEPFAPELEGTEVVMRGGVTGADLTEKIKQYDVSGNPDDWSMGYLEKRGVPREIAQRWFDAEIGSASTKYSQYTLPGGNDYREILVKAPLQKNSNIRFSKELDAWQVFEDGKERARASFPTERGALEWAKENGISSAFSDIKIKSWNDSHWPDENPLFWVRMNNRQWNNNKVAFMEELQKAKDAPKDFFDKGWQIPATKKALLDAVENDADVFAWINGAQTSERYKLSTQVDTVKWESNKAGWEGKKQIYVNAKSGRDIIIKLDDKGTILKGQTVPTDWQGKKLDEVLGKGLADSIMSKESGTLSGEGLEFGGEWAKNLYDRQVRDIVKKLTGAEVKSADMGLPIAKSKFDVFTYADGNDAGGFVVPNRLKVGDKIADERGTEFQVTKKDADGHIKAIPTSTLDDYSVVKASFSDKWKVKSDSQTFDTLEEAKKAAKDYMERSSRDFNLDSGNTNKTTQQYITLTPEVKAKIKSEAPKFKMKDGVNVGMPLLLAYLYAETTSETQ